MITHLLAIDGGGTKTALRLTSIDPLMTDPIFTLTLGPSSLTQQGEQAHQQLHQAIGACLQQIKLAASHVSIVIGVAGAGNAKAKLALEQSLQIYPHCVVTTDAHISLLGVNHGQAVNCIAIGTGSVATQLDADGHSKMYGGWGFPIGDHGGGAWLGQQAVQALIEALEQETSHPLTDYLTQHLGGQRGEVLQWLTTANASRFAQLAPAVLDHAQQGCPVSTTIVNRGQQHIDSLVAKCCDNNKLDIAFLGSLGAYYQQHLSPKWSSRLITPKGDALDGATLLARQQVENYNE
ncbi:MULTISPECIES: BadF/BadG/BcrA/BcrD ATPase family protein [Vibrio]|uniref:BadF/BadG/BcrA/BcrD ATPase family protein n=2 Tax=Vibrionaceae TaxID=641 RepID=UPI0020751345|nr:MULTISPECIES: BadF/BadG/BcrA/BcrD ATPase family protein [Vibrio]USD33017.1 N-acetylglucosamine kinase [Vibrio sp. SCSIO 43186]USD46085.1 N-acetylglucosamine kinase [Vibrio sp. SCSIO 43145]USD70141.1 N-acetylglucosamine kinase [Vibrio sp. SCSIO 43139]USD95056.1 N-acetylglucosamine kinase [Vibrio coralliilyticus]